MSPFTWKATENCEKALYNFESFHYKSEHLVHTTEGN